jgi:hypothetical protein
LFLWWGSIYFPEAIKGINRSRITMKKTAAPEGVGWGTTNTPKEKWIDPTKTYKTRKGKRVEHLEIVMHNSCGDEVTFPVKGTIVLKEKPRRTKFTIWTLDGKGGVLPDLFYHAGDNPSERDLVEA